MAERQIVALGGGGFSEESTTLLDDYILGLRPRRPPKVCFLPTASGDADGYIEKFYAAFREPRAVPSHVSLFHGPSLDPQPETLVNLGGLREHLLAQDVIYVGGGNTVALLAVWRAHGLDALLREAWDAGVVLCGLSAGSLCWFASGTTDAHGDGLQPWFDGLGFIPASHSPHYDSEPERRPTYQRLVGAGVLTPGYAADDGAAFHFVDDKLLRVVASRPDAKGYFIGRDGDRAVEATLDTQVLG